MRAKLMTLLSFGLLVASSAGCDWWPRLETRTFRVEHLTPASVQDLITPYVYSDRVHWPGAMSVTQGAITIRETRDNLARIERVLQEFDVAAPSLRLHFQLIEADGPSGTPDPAIADVVDELRRLFRFQGYRLLGETVVTTGEGGINQTIPGMSGAGNWSVSVDRVSQPQPGSIVLDGLALWSDPHTIPLRTGLTLSIGQTVVIGSAASSDGNKTVVLTVKADTSDEGRPGRERREGERRE